MMERVSEELRRRLRSLGVAVLDVGDVCVDLATGEISRIITLDGVEKARAVFPSAEIDWDIVAAAI